MTTQNRVFLSSLESASSSPFTVLQLFCFTFSPLCPPPWHIETLKWLLLQMWHGAGEPLGDLFCQYCRTLCVYSLPEPCDSRQVSECLGVFPYQLSMAWRWAGLLCLPPPELLTMVAGRVFVYLSCCVAKSSSVGFFSHSCPEVWVHWSLDVS